jgi:F-type H+-transporting ATPase subunit delta
MTELASKKWAKALIELTQEDEGISKEEVLSDLRDVAENIENSEELKNVINNPSISAEEKQIVISKLFQNRIMPIVYNFLFALNLKKRMDLISEIADEFEKELEELKNIVRVDITSAIDLSDERKNDIRNRIAEKLQKDVKVSWGVDADIIAGLIFNINDTVVDNSIKNKLDKLTEKIIKG